MLTTKSIIASLLVLGSLTSVAAAAPCAETPVRQSTVTSQPVYEQPVYEQPVYQQPIYQPTSYQPPADGWHRGHGPVRQAVTLATDIRFNADGRQFITVGATHALDKITITSDGGITNLKKVAVLFKDGSEQAFRIGNKALTVNESLTLDLAGNNRKAISRIVVYGTESAPRIWRTNGHAGFTVTAV